MGDAGGVEFVPMVTIDLPIVSALILCERTDAGVLLHGAQQGHPVQRPAEARPVRAEFDDEI